MQRRPPSTLPDVRAGRAVWWLDRTPVWALGALGAGALWAYLIATWGAHGAPARLNVDLQVYRTAGHALYAGTFSYQHLYGNYALLPFTYPPFGLFAVSPLSLIPAAVVDEIWWGVNAVSLLLVVGLSWRQVSALKGFRLYVITALVAGLALWFVEPVRSNADFGQINTLLILAVLLDTTCIRGRWRGVLVGVAAAIKLTPIVFVAFFLLQRDRRAALTSLATFVAAMAGGWIVLPSGSRWFWLTQIRQTSHIGNLSYVGNQSWRGLIARLSIPSGVASGLWLLAALVTLAAAVVLARSLLADGRMIPALFALALGELLISPISWTHHWSWLVLAPAVAWSERRRLPALSVALVALLALAVWQPYWKATHDGWWFPLSNSLALLGGLVLLGWTWAELRLASRPAQPAPLSVAAGSSSEPVADGDSALPQLGSVGSRGHA